MDFTEEQIKFIEDTAKELAKYGLQAPAMVEEVQKELLEEYKEYLVILKNEKMLLEADLQTKLTQIDALETLIQKYEEPDSPTPIPIPDPDDPIDKPTGTFISKPGTEENNDCTPWKRVKTGNIELENNVWGTQGDGRYQSCLITHADGSYGWTWSTPAGLNNNVKMYLQSVTGHKPFFHYTLGEGFPFTGEEVKSFKASFKSETTATGKYNLAFEFWTVKEYHGDNEYINKTRAGGNNITGEYMFWMQAHFGMPIAHSGQIIDGRKWNVSVGGGEQKYVAFIPADGNDITSAVIDFKPFIEWLSEKKLLNKKEKIISLELGNEIIEGEGKTRITDYQVAIEK